MDEYLDRLAMPKSSIDIGNNYSCFSRKILKCHCNYALNIFTYFSHNSIQYLSERYLDIEGG